MNENTYLNEEKYRRTERTIIWFAALLLIIGLSAGGYLIYRGIAKPGTVKVEELKAVLVEKKSELEAKGVRYNTFAKYTDGETYDLKIITDALDPSFDHCAFDEYRSNPLTADYCKAKNSISEYASTTSIMLGAFISIASLMISGAIFAMAKRRQILAYQIQQVMPVAKEAIDEMTPTAGSSAGKIAEEVARGIKKGLTDDE